tara:strand:+ start:650 stop:859 length:210 start_codon:yes stop_codon:yes gene_type:complete
MTMKKMIVSGLILILLLVVGCEQTIQDSEVTPVSNEEAEIDDSFNELNDLDALDEELDLDFDEIEGYLE